MKLPIYQESEFTATEESSAALLHKFRSLIENSNDGVAIFSKDGELTYVSPAIETILGYTEDECMRMDISSIVHPDNLEANVQLMQKALGNPGVAIRGYVKRMKHKDGSWRWIESTLVNRLDDPALEGIIDNFRDITERKLAEERLHYANRLYAFTSALNHTIVHCTDEQTLFREACRIATEIAQFKMAWIGLIDEPADLLKPEVCAGEGCEYLTGIRISTLGHLAEGNGPTGIAVRENRSAICNDIKSDRDMDTWKEKALQYGFRSSIALPIHKSGNVIGSFTLYSPVPGFFDSEEVRLLEAAARDISFALDLFQKEKLRESLTAKLKHHELVLLRAQEVANFGSYEVDLRTRTAVWSDQFCAIYGVSACDSVQSLESWMSFIHPEDLEYVTQELYRSDTTARNINIHYRIIRRDGAVRNIFCYRQIEFDRSGKPVGAFVVAHDITDEMANMTEIKRQNEKLRNIAWTQSHKVRAPLANILGLCQLLRETAGTDDYEKVVAGLMASAERLDGVIAEIVTNTRESTFHNRGLPIDLY